MPIQGKSLLENQKCQISNPSFVCISIIFREKQNDTVNQLLIKVELGKGF